jgi:hypothetical protein
MGTTAKDAGGDFELTPAGTHLAICYMVADLGHQETSYGMKPKIVIGWELPAELMTDGRPFGASQIYTLSLSEKANLRKDLEAWRGRPFTDAELDGFDVKNVLGKPCTLTIVHNKNGDKTYANIASVAGVMKGMQVPERVNDLLYFNMDEPDRAVLQRLPKWVQTKIAAAHDAPEPATAGGDDDPLNDDIPF